MVMLAHSQPESTPVYPHKLRRLYWPFLALAEVCREVVGTVAGSFESSGNRYTIPRFAFHGPVANVPPIRLGLFGLIRGDELAGALGLQHFLNALVDNPTFAAGYELVIYPLCNPTGYEDDTPHNRTGLDLNREFWRGSTQPEVQILQDELRRERFDGVIALHADGSSEGFRGYTQDQALNEHLVAPALQASSHILPANQVSPSGGLPAGNERIEDDRSGVLAAPPEQNPRPFEMVFATPAGAPMTQQIEAISCALRSILKEYRSFIAQRANP